MAKRSSSRAQKIGRALPDTIDVAFPYYGDALDRFIRNYDIPLTSDIQIRGSKVDDEFLAFRLNAPKLFAKVVASLRRK